MKRKESITNGTIEVRARKHTLHIHRDTIDDYYNADDDISNISRAPFVVVAAKNEIF